MYKIKYISVLAFLSIMFLASCSDDSNTLSPENSLKDRVTTGDWIITYYWDDDKDETSDFSGYVFTFMDSGQLIALKDTTSIDGTWRSFTDDSELILNIKFVSPQTFEDISDDWHVVEQTDTKIRLEDLSGGDGSTDFLTFEKK